MGSKTIDYEMQIPAIFSIVGSLFMILSYVLFRNIRSLKYFQIILYVSINDFLASIGMSLGNVPTGSSACWFQGIATNYNYLSSIFWTTVLAYEIYSIVKLSSGIKNLTPCHLICWAFPLVVALLPLSTNTYANPGSNGWCFIGEREDSPNWGLIFWVIMSYYLWVWLCIALVSYLYLATMIHFYQAQHYQNEEMSRTITMLSLYPILLIVCWTLTSIVDISTTFAHPTQTYASGLFGGLALILPALQGFMHSVIFVMRSKVIRNTWKDFFREGKMELIFYTDDGFGTSRTTSFYGGNNSKIKNGDFVELSAVANVLNPDHQV